MIIDLKRFAIGDIFNHKQLIAELFTHYPCRLGKIYLLRGNKTLNGLSKLIPQNTLVKVSWIEAKSEMLNFFNPQQLETRFGGSALNLKSFWPPVVPNSSFRAANDCIQDFLSNFSSYKEYFPTNPKICSDLSSLKASQVGERESFLSNNDFKDEVWQRLELISASYSFLTMDQVKTQENEEKTEKNEKILKIESEENTKETLEGNKKLINNSSELPLICNICNSECLLL